MNHIDKVILLSSWGLDIKDIENTWAYNNIEDAKNLNDFFENFLEGVKSII